MPDKNVGRTYLHWKSMYCPTTSNSFWHRCKSTVYSSSGVNIPMEAPSYYLANRNKLIPQLYPSLISSASYFLQLGKLFLRHIMKPMLKYINLGVLKVWKRKSKKIDNAHSLKTDQASWWSIMTPIYITLQTKCTSRTEVHNMSTKHKNPVCKD